MCDNAPEWYFDLKGSWDIRVVSIYCDDTVVCDVYWSAREDRWHATKPRLKVPATILLALPSDVRLALEARRVEALR